MKELVIATRNEGKMREIRALLPHFHLLSLKDIGFEQEIPEPYDTFRENAYAKAIFVARFCRKNVLADDSGIAVDALQGAPGVWSARYAGTHATDQANLHKLLAEMAGKTNRSAHYTAVICLIYEGEAHYFEATCTGTLLTAPCGQGGFGYDPVFVPSGFQQTFAELDSATKNQISHRGKALRSMMHFLASNG
jgi:XTP/dITP diphosphohydrolase